MLHVITAHMHIYLYKFYMILIDFIHIKSGIKITQPENRETASFHAIEIIAFTF